MADQFYAPQAKVNWSSKDAFAQFQLWKKEVERIIDGPLASRSDKVKINHIYIWAGAHAESLIEASLNEDPNLKINNPSELLQQLAACLTHETFFREQREAFYNAKQSPSENTTAYFSRIMELHRQSQFPDNSTFLVVDKLIHGCSSRECKKKLMSKGKDLSLKDCLAIMRRFESVEATMAKLETPVDAHVDASSYALDPTVKSQRKGRKGDTTRRYDKSKTCVWCQRETHSREKCPAKDATCNFCKKRGHFERACLQKKRQQGRRELHQNAVHASTNDPYSSGYEDEFDLSPISVNILQQESPREVFAPITFIQQNPKLSVTVKGKVDTGAMVSCMPMSMLTKIGLSESNIKASKAVIRGVSGANLQNCGTVDVKVTCNNITSNTTFFVTKCECTFILGLDFCRDFDLVSIAPVCTQKYISIDPDNIEAVHITEESEVNYDKLRSKWKAHLPLGRKTGDNLDDLKEIFPDAFDGQVGLFEGEATLKLTPDARPAQLPPRAVPQSIMPKLKKELDTMEQDGIIRPCPETTEWVHNLVIVAKKDGSLRLCLDPRNLNKYLIRSVHYTASWEDVMHSLKDGLYFSTLDAKSGYWTKCLDQQSQLLTAFNTPFKKYCFQRLPFGLSVSAEIFCEHMDRILAGVPGTFPCADDVKVQGSTAERHDIHLLETVDKANQAGLKFNPNKCVIKKQEVEYFGRVITPQGVAPCPKKIQAISSLSAPKDKQELQSLLGSVNFLATFIPNLTKRTYLMRSLLKQGVHFIWTQDMQKELDVIKDDIVNATKLIHYDPSKPIIIETDASQKGLGAVLIQDERPVRFLSKALTQAEMNYSNIERELLAIMFACEKLHTYTFGRKVVIHTDHKPLQSIFQKPISLAPARLQRMLLRLSKYDVQVKYVGANSVLIADTLSRLIDHNNPKEIPGLDVNIAQILKIEPTRLETLQEETKSDSFLKDLMSLIITGWPESMQDVPQHLHPYWCFRDELTIVDGLIMKGNRVVVPAALRPSTLDRLHDAHQGITSTLQRARRTVYWPKMQDDITQLIQKCDECQRHGIKKTRVPARQIAATRPMEVIGMDLLDFNGQAALVMIDYYSGFITFDMLPNQTSKSVIKALNNIFSKFGLPERIICDNGPCYKSESFRSFCQSLDIGYTTSSPYHHQSNGRAERAIGTVKQILRKAKSQTDITKAITAYLDTPVSELLPSPAELFHNRRINTRLSMNMLPAPLTDQQRTHLNEKRSAHLKPSQGDHSYLPNQPVWFTDDTSDEWKPGYIESRDTAPDSYWIINDKSNRRLRRNKHDIKPRHNIALHRPQDFNSTRQQTSNLPPYHLPGFDQSVALTPEEPVSRDDPPREQTEPLPASPRIKTTADRRSSDRQNEATGNSSNSDALQTRTRSGREIRSTKNPDYVYI